MTTTKARLLLRLATAAHARGWRQTYYRLAVTAVEAENAHRVALGWQPLYISPQARAIADGYREAA